jgi:hypothetical protein
MEDGVFLDCLPGRLVEVTTVQETGSSSETEKKMDVIKGFISK